jgi:hypothetical protein
MDTMETYWSSDFLIAANVVVPFATFERTLSEVIDTLDMSVFNGRHPIE